jgi:hypothetical protein
LTEQQPVVTLDLYAEEPVLGSNETRFVREARISFGRPTIAQVAEDSLPVHLQRRLDSDRLKYTEVRLSFDLTDLPASRRYTQATVRMTFDDVEVRSVQLTAEPKPDPGTELATWGEGREELTWQLTARDGMRPGGRKVGTVLECPLATVLLTGVLDAQVEVTRSVLGTVKTTVARTMDPLRFTLDIGSGESGFSGQAQ